MAKQKSIDMERFVSIRARIVDLYQYGGQAIRDKKTVTASAIVFAEQKWMVDEIERVAGGPLDESDKARYAKIRAFVARMMDELGGAIKGGEFVKVSAAIFGASRFLIKCLERIAFVLDEEAAAAIAAVRMPDAKTSRIEIDIDDAVADTPEETEKAINDLGGVVAEPPPDDDDDI